MKRSLLLLLPFVFAACSQTSDPVAPVQSSAADIAAKKSPPGDNEAREGYDETDLVSDIHSLHGKVIDGNLVNAWGLAFNPGGILWVSNNGSGTSTLYDESGAKQSLVVTVPASGGGTGAPTGVVFNGTSDFTIPSSTKARFIFAVEDGSIAAWSGGTSAVTVANAPTAGAAYKGIALASNGGANFLYLTDFHNNRIDVFNASFEFVSFFTDATVPAGYAPFGIHTINGQLWVTFAKQKAPDNHDDEAGPGNGFVDVFNPNGTMIKRFASHGSLNSPWAVTLAPAGFGAVSDAILVGNFGDGHIGAYNASTGSFLGFMNAKDHKPLEIEGLWDLTFGPGAAATTLYFSAGPQDESHGQLGTLTPRKDKDDD